MAMTELQTPPSSSEQVASHSVADAALEQQLVQSGRLNAEDLADARTLQALCGQPLDQVLVADGVLSAQVMTELRAQIHGCRAISRIELEELRPIPVGIPAQVLLKHAVLPVRDRDDTAAVICASPEDLHRARPHLPASLQDATMILANRDMVTQRIGALHKSALVQAAAARTPAAESCRTWANTRGKRVSLFTIFLCGVLSLSVLYPQMVFSGLAGIAAITLIVSACFKALAFSARAVSPMKLSVLSDASDIKRLPKVSVLVPLFRETEVARVLIARLKRLSYPKSLLDVVLVLEEEDGLTSKTLAKTNLPPWIKVVVVPDGRPRTKPRAMNYALDFCEGEIIGVLDAEDAPDPDQIMRVARRFDAAPKDVACLQGILDYYNPRQNWLARCFTIEYAAWFRMILPGVARLGLAIPLGGTTLYFRRDVLEKLGGWDAHNVTEDADLGFRLARYGYRTEMLVTVTEEEANCRPWAWVKQRSRWLKGYMTTYLVHMRQPVLLYRQLGARKFWGFQAHFVTALSQPLLAPFLLSFWLVLLGLPHPLDPLVSRSALMTVGLLFLMIEAVNICIGLAAVFKPKHRHLLPWVPTLHLYWPLGAIAAYKALYELVLKPFFWDKTQHGLSLNQVSPPEKHASAEGFDLT